MKKGLTEIIFVLDESDRKSVVQGKSVDLGGRRIVKKKKTKQHSEEADKNKVS